MLVGEPSYGYCAERPQWVGPQRLNGGSAVLFRSLLKGSLPSRGRSLFRRSGWALVSVVVVVAGSPFAGAGVARAAGGGCGTQDTPPSGVGSVYVSFFGCTRQASYNTIALQPHSAVGAGPTSCAEVATIYENGSYIGTRQMACNLNGSPETVITVTAGASYSFTWYMYLVVHGAAYYSTVDASPNLNLPYGNCTTHACHVGVIDTDAADQKAIAIQSVIAVPSSPQTRIDTAASTGWVFANLQNGYAFQAGYITDFCSDGKVAPFTQWWRTVKGVGTKIGGTTQKSKCGVTGSHTFLIKAIGPDSSKIMQWEAFMDGSPIIDDASGKPPIMTAMSTVADTGANLPYAAAELSIGGDLYPTYADLLGPYVFTTAFESLAPPPNPPIGWHDSTSANNYFMGSTCPPLNNVYRSKNSFAAGTLNGSCAVNGTRIW